MRRWSIVGLVAAPLMGFPLFAGALVTVDTILGEGSFVYQLTYERRALAEGFAHDFMRALPVSYLAAVVILLGSSILGATGFFRSRLSLGFILGLSVGFGVGRFVSGYWAGVDSIALAIAGAIFGLACLLPLELRAKEVSRTSA